MRPSEEFQPNFSLVGARVIYDLVFFIVVTVLGLNLVIVILVDRFSEMREKKVLNTTVISSLFDINIVG